MKDETRMTREEWLAHYRRLKEQAKDPDAKFTFEEYKTLVSFQLIDDVVELAAAVALMRELLRKAGIVNADQIRVPDIVH